MKIQRMIERPMDYQRLATKPKDRNQLALLHVVTSKPERIDPGRRCGCRCRCGSTND